MDIGAISLTGDNSGKRFEYRQRAAECRKLADDVCSEDSRRELLDLADIWMALADTRRSGH